MLSCSGICSARQTRLAFALLGSLNARAGAPAEILGGVTMGKKAVGVVLVLIVVLAGCKGSHGGASGQALRLAMIPSTDPGKIVRDNQPLVKYLEQETGSHIELVVPTNYAAVVEAIANDKVDYRLSRRFHIRAGFPARWRCSPGAARARSELSQRVHYSNQIEHCFAR